MKINVFIFMVTFIKEGRKLKFITSNLSEKKIVMDSLTFAVEGTEFSSSFKRGKWDGMYRFYEKNVIDYGMLSVVTKQLNKKQIKWVLNPDFQKISLRGKTIRHGLWEHQIQAINAFFNRPFGRVKFPTRTGKTVFAAECIRLIEGISLFVVDTQDLFLQAINDISGYLKIQPDRIGKIGVNHFEIKQINVATVQTLQKYYYRRFRSNKNRIVDKERAKDLKRLFELLDFLIVDECHEHSSMDRVGMFKSIKNCCAYLALSATPNASEGLLKNLRLQSCYGDIIFEADREKLKEQRILSKEEILLIALDHNKNKNIKILKKDVYDNYEDKIIIHNRQRNQIVVNVIEICRKLKLKLLVLFIYRDHAMQVQQITGDELITGKNILDDRVDARERFLRKKGGVLLATNIFKKGITLPEAEVMFNVGGGLEQSEIDQKKGRVLGTTKTKNKALIIDFVDIFKYFDRHSLNRIEVYEQHAGIDNIHIFNFSDQEFYQDIKEFLQTWSEQRQS